MLYYRETLELRNGVKELENYINSLNSKYRAKFVLKKTRDDISKALLLERVTLCGHLIADVISRLATLPVSRQGQTWACFSAISNAFVSGSGIDLGISQTLMPLPSSPPSCTRYQFPLNKSSLLIQQNQFRQSSAFDPIAIPSTSTTFPPDIRLYFGPKSFSSPVARATKNPHTVSPSFTFSTKNTNKRLLNIADVNEIEGVLIPFEKYTQQNIIPYINTDDQEE
ncbi:unnamed protein product [Didymodactylos carnosus]|uniref:Uncharacterized protein n=1 Tax=Didymodactylos carnosus TaxID=1234261 RepID=A0A814RMH1_9BILA|nr:unnamed protein product [Didymodactylos carnosus]CAF1135406.1 unnamed protein product [Didymodactylos carnosus]CAF3784331.1 unnamed protein product [Didymodactylos carnosus]CAF3899135.1 unnamed protein product [Didymodactylos carnosus]